MTNRYTIGIDFGTESGRVVLVDVRNGKEMATHVTMYPHGVIDQELPTTSASLPPDYALQAPDDYLFVLKESVPKVMALSGVAPEDVIGIGLDFTACTLLPVDESFEPLCYFEKWKTHPHAWVKLWKHHGAHKEANRMTELAIERDEAWLSRYGHKLSSEWVLPKIWEILNEAPNLYEATPIFLEAADWLVAKMTGRLIRNSCGAGYKGLWNKREGYPSKEFLIELDPRLETLYETKLKGPVVPPGTKAGELSGEMADLMGLRPGIAVSAGMIDAHAAVPGVGVATPEKLVLVMGTSTCHLVLSEQEVRVEGISGVVEDGIIPGLFAYEAGQAAVGDLFAWFVQQQVPIDLYLEAEKQGKGLHDLLEEKASRLTPGESGLIALDWHNGNRTPLVDADLSGLIIGQTLRTKPEEIYRALIESTAFGTRLIMDTYKNKGIEIKEIYATGGIPHRNRLLMQIYADVTNKTIKLSRTTLTTAIGAAMLGAVAAGKENGGYGSIIEASENMSSPSEVVFQPIPQNVLVYEKLYEEYVTLHTYFGQGVNPVMKKLKQLQRAQFNKRD
ncbi:MAG TPA: ribulokinase [Sporolactobacillaceae bacterium]|nr:ribulokinase [Sporolactobacillaceae bacterium]